MVWYSCNNEDQKVLDSSQAEVEPHGEYNVKCIVHRINLMINLSSRGDELAFRMPLEKHGSAAMHFGISSPEAMFLMDMKLSIHKIESEITHKKNIEM